MYSGKTQLVLVILMLTAACAVPKQTNAMEDLPLLWTEYEAAVAAAKYPTQSAIYRNLAPIIEDNPDLTWKDGKVLMVSWTSSQYTGNLKPGDTQSLTWSSWFTAVPYLKNFCTSYRDGDLTLRLAQRLGMPPDATNDVMVEYWVDPADMFRPCPDPEIYDSQCVVRIPLVDQGPRTGPDQPPWYCGSDPDQQAADFVTVNPAHLAWMCNNWTGSYTGGNPQKYYPWTALGYTYDWGGPSPVGESEYVISGSKTEPVEVIVASITPAAQYCGRTQ